MKVYNEDGRSMNADKDQMEILIEAGWTKSKPEVKPDLDELKRQKDEADQALLEAQESADAEALALEEAEMAELEAKELASQKAVSAPKKITVPKKK